MGGTKIGRDADLLTAMSTNWAESAEISKASKTLQSIIKAYGGAGNKMVKFCTAHQVLLQNFVPMRWP